MNPIIRKATESDLDVVCEIELQTFPDPWPRFLFEELLKNPSQSLYILEREHSHERMGYMALWKILDEVHILNVCVSPNYQRQGLGAFLMQSCLELYSKEEVSVFSLEVRKSNEAAQKLYEKFGFKIKFVRAQYYPNKEDALVMALFRS